LITSISFGIGLTWGKQRSTQNTIRVGQDPHTTGGFIFQVKNIAGLPCDSVCLRISLIALKYRT